MSPENRALMRSIRKDIGYILLGITTGLILGAMLDGSQNRPSLAFVLLFFFFAIAGFIMVRMSR
jgi:hypothetical protein